MNFTSMKKIMQAWLYSSKTLIKRMRNTKFRSPVWSFIVKGHPRAPAVSVFCFLSHLIVRYIILLRTGY